MEQSKDFIEREIQKLTLLLINLLSKLSAFKAEDFAVEIQEVNQALEEEFDLSIEQFSNLEPQDLIIQLEKIPETHLEKIAEIFYHVVKNIDETEGNNQLSKSRLKNNTLFLINYLNQNSSTFSYQRMALENDLQKL